MINEQEKVDAEVARDLADKLKRETDRERKKLNQQNEILARKLQDRQRPQPVGNDYPAPPRNHPKPNHLKNSPKTQSIFTQKTNQLNYVSLDLEPPKSTQLPSKSTPTAYTEILPSSGFHPIETNLKFTTPEKKQQQPVNLHSHTPEKNYSNSRKYDFPQIKSSSTDHHFDDDGVSGLFINTNQELSGFGPIQDVADSIRQYHMPSEDIPTANNFRNEKHFPYDDDFRNNSNFQKLSPEKYDYIIGNGSLVRNPQQNDSKVNEVGLPTGTLYKNRENNFGGDPERIKTLQELGLPPEEIQEIDRRLRQEIRDEELARKLQDEEKVEIDQEERDRLLAMEAQDKELARMLQERVSDNQITVLLIKKKIQNFSGKSKSKTCKRESSNKETTTSGHGTKSITWNRK